MCFTDNDGLAQKVKSLRIHGKGSNKYDNVRIGINGRLDTLQAAILLVKMEIFDTEITRRREIATNYSKLLLNSELSRPLEPKGYESAWAQYSLLAKDSKSREGYQKRLSQKKIPSVVYYPIPLHLQAAFRGLGYRSGDFPVSEDCSQRIFSLPMHPYLTDAHQKMIVDTILDT